MENWLDVVAYLRTKGYHYKVQVLKPFQDPAAAGMYQSWGTPVGQQNDFRLALSDNKGLHVREFPTYYQAHLDEIDPSKNLLGHVVVDMPLTLLPVGFFLLKRG